MIGALALIGRSGLRSRLRGWIAVTLLAALAAGAVAAAVAGARRTDSAYARFLAAERAPDYLVLSNQHDDTFASIPHRTAATMPGVIDSVHLLGYGVVHPSDVSLFGSSDPRLGSAIWRRKLLHGREPRRDRADEVAVSTFLAQQHHVSVGDALRLTLEPARDGAVPTQFTFHVVGIEASPSEFPPQIGTGIFTVWTTAAFVRTHAPEWDVTAVRLRPGSAARTAFTRRMSQLANGKPLQTFALRDQAVNTQRSIHLQAVALWLLAALLAAAGLLIVAQLVVRQVMLASVDHSTFVALGLTRTEVWLSAMLAPTLVGVVGALLGLVIAFAVSPLAPIGLAQIAEPHPGFAFDAFALGLCALVTVLLVVAIAAWPAWRAASVAPRGERRVHGRRRRWNIAHVLTQTEAPATATEGVRLAFERGRGRTSVPVRTTLIGAMIGVAALVGAVVFDTSVAHLLSSPSLYGVSWDARIANVVGQDVTPTVRVVRRDPDVAAASIGYSGAPLVVDDARIDGIALRPVSGGSLMPVATAGRRPARAGEIMLGERTLAALHTHIGGVVHVSVASASPKPMPVRVVGIGVFPTLSDGLTLGKGAALTPEGLVALVPGLPPSQFPRADTVLVRFRPGVDTDRALARLDHAVRAAGTYEADAPVKPVDLVNFGRVQNLPLVLGGLLAFLALATLAHLLLTSIRRRRRHLALLKVLGFVPAQVRRVVAWQATSLAIAAVAIGVPAGVLAGHWAWRVFARQLGVLAPATVPWTVLALLVPATVVLANLIALAPAWSAARVQAARVLSSE